MNEPQQVSIHDATAIFAQKMIDLGVSKSDTVQALLSVAAGITLKDIGADRAKQYFADVALHVFDDPDC